MNKYYDISVDDTVPRARALGDFSMRGQESVESATKSSAAFCLRSIFDSLLLGLFPDDYFNDEVLEYIERSENGEEVYLDEPPEETIIKIIAPLAIKRSDDSYGYQETFEMICDRMDCSWGNLQTRYMNKNNVNEPPSKAAIITSNANVLRKFKKTLSALLEDDEDL